MSWAEVLLAHAMPPSSHDSYTTSDLRHHTPSSGQLKAHLPLRGLPVSSTLRNRLLPLPGGRTPRPLLLLVQHAAVQLLKLLLQAPQLLLQLLCSLAVLSFEVLQQPVQAAMQLSLSTPTQLLQLPVQAAVQLSLRAQTQGTAATQAQPASDCHLLVLSSWLSAMLCRFKLSEAAAGAVDEESQWNENEPSALRPAAVMGVRPGTLQHSCQTKLAALHVARPGPDADSRPLMSPVRRSGLLLTPGFNSQQAMAACQAVQTGSPAPALPSEMLPCWPPAALSTVCHDRSSPLSWSLAGSSRGPAAPASKPSIAWCKSLASAWRCRFCARGCIGALADCCSGIGAFADCCGDVSAGLCLMPPSAGSSAGWACSGAF